MQVGDGDATDDPCSRREHIMVSDTTTIRPRLDRDEAATLFGKTMGLVAVTAGAFALGAYLGRNVAYQWGWLFFICSLLCLVGLNRAAQRSEQTAMTLLFGFGLLTGLAVAPTLAYYASADPQAIWLAGGATALFVAGFGAAGYATRRDRAPRSWVGQGNPNVTYYRQADRGGHFAAWEEPQLFSEEIRAALGSLRRGTDPRATALITREEIS